MELTDERAAHIKSRHGGSIRDVRQFVKDALQRPDIVASHRVGPELGFIRWADSADGTPIAVVIVLTDSPGVRDSGNRHIGW